MLCSNSPVYDFELPEGLLWGWFFILGQAALARTFVERPLAATQMAASGGKWLQMAAGVLYHMNQS